MCFDPQLPRDKMAEAICWQSFAYGNSGEEMLFMNQTLSLLKEIVPGLQGCVDPKQPVHECQIQARGNLATFPGEKEQFGAQLGVQAQAELPWGAASLSASAAGMFALSIRSPHLAPAQAQLLCQHQSSRANCPLGNAMLLVLVFLCFLCPQKMDPDLRDRLLQSGAMGGSDELPCKDVCLSPLKGPEGNKIRLGQLIYRQLKQISEMKTRHAMKAIKHNPRSRLTGFLLGHFEIFAWKQTPVKQVSRHRR